jgi:MFS transporter, putative metabolite:H+ symporter
VQTQDIIAAGGRPPTDSALTDVTERVVARLERLPLTSYQRGVFAIVATAWLFDSIDLGSLTFVLGSIREEFGLSTHDAACSPA